MQHDFRHQRGHGAGDSPRLEQFLVEGFQIDHHRITPLIGLDLEIVPFVEAVVQTVPCLKSRREPFLEIPLKTATALKGVQEAPECAPVDLVQRGPRLLSVRRDVPSVLERLAA